MRKFLGTSARWLTALGVVLMALAVVAGWFEGHWWGLHLLVHFPLQITLVGSVLLMLAMVLRLPMVAVLAGLCLIAQIPALAWTYGTWSPGSAAAAPRQPAASQTLVVTTFNMGGGRVDEARFLEYVDAKDPDILLLQESYRLPKRLLVKLAERFDNFGPGRELRRHSRMIFSDYPIPTAHRIRVARRSSFLVFTVDVGERPVTVITLHAANPVSKRGFEARNRLFGALAENMPHYNRPIIVAGDFNTTSWSRYFETLLRDTGLRDAAEGEGWVSTWPARAGSIGIGIDHVLVSDQVEVAWIAAGPDLGSDHRPVTAWLKLRP